jgi:hypothetical protein
MQHNKQFGIIYAIWLNFTMNMTVLIDLLFLIFLVIQGCMACKIDGACINISHLLSQHKLCLMHN